MDYETVVWLAPTLVGVAVFAAVCAVFWPRKAPVPNGIDWIGSDRYDIFGNEVDPSWTKPLGRHEKPASEVHVGDMDRGRHMK